MGPVTRTLSLKRSIAQDAGDKFRVAREEGL